MNNTIDNWPRNLQAESMLLGNVILNNGIAAQVLYELSAEDFDLHAHRYVFIAMRELDRKGMGIDPLTITNELRIADKLTEVGGQAFIASLFDGVPRFSDVSNYVKLVKDASVLRRALKLGIWIGNEAQSFDVNAEDFIFRLMTQVEDLQNARVTDDLISSERAIERTMLELENRWANSGELPGISTGYSDLDKELLGLRAKYYVLAAGTGIGKTTLALNWAVNIVTADPTKVGLIISLEMSVEELKVKILSTVTRIDSHRIESGDLSEFEKQQIREAAEILKKLPIEYVEGFSPVTARSIEARVDKVRRKHGHIDFLIVDYLQLLDADSKHDNEHQKLTEISRTLKRINLKHKIPVVALSQLNRDHMKRANRDYILSDLRASGSIEQDADVVLFLMPEDWTDPENSLRRLHIAKHRAGKKDRTIRLVFFGSQSRFEAAARDFEYSGGGEFNASDYEFMPQEPKAKSNGKRRMTADERRAWLEDYAEGVLP